jgi:ribosomal protein L17
MHELKNDVALSEEDKKKKTEGKNADLEKKRKAILLTDAETKAVNEFFEYIRNNAPNRNGGMN